MPTNRLAHESSPYLLQHAHNPVDWFPWGSEAFETARSQNKPIFLSVGYSTCYWCHVMERQCFENPAIAEVMNRCCINIKVDREERPDVDQLYMNFVQVLTRGGGWPMSVFLTPDLRPIYGGTYFPPEDNYGRPGFSRIVQSVADAFRERSDEMQGTINEYVTVLKLMAEPRTANRAIIIDDAWIEKLVDRSTRDFDSHFGGFGSAPKFPRQTLLELLLVYNRRRPNQARILMIRKTLDALGYGGIRDQLGGGFHRYSTDAKWLVPHFEIMLYDNAMLGWIFSEAFAQFQEPRYAELARGIFDFILREMASPDGAFYTALDAEVDGQEGLNYLWTQPEIERILDADDAKTFNRVYGVAAGPNFADPHHGTGKPNKNILFLPEPLSTVATAMTLDEPGLAALLEPMRQKLYAARSERKQPILDTKILTGWNALMIRALAHGGKVLHEKRYTMAAEKAGYFLLDHHRQSDGSLYRTSRDGKPKYDAFLDDYASLAQAFVDLHEVVGGQWRDEAAAVATQMIDRFSDAERGGFYFTAEGAADLIVRQKVSSDSPLPSGNAMAAMVLMKLGKQEPARKMLGAFARTLDDQAEGMGSMVQAALEYVATHGSMNVEAVADRASAKTATLKERAEDVIEVQGAWATPTQLNIRLIIAESYHLYASRTTKEYIATELRIADKLAGNVAGIEYPPADELKFPFSDIPLAVYRGETDLVVRFHSIMRTGETVRLALIYQACTEDSCLPAVTKQLEIAAP